MIEQHYDIGIIGAGPAGLTAAIYAARARRRVLVLERAVTGGQIATTDVVENYPGFPDGINGFELGQAMLQQAERFGASVEYTACNAIERVDEESGAPRFRLRTDEGDTTVKTVIVTAGADYNQLGVPGEERLVGRGVSYCGTCDAAFFRNQPVAVIGGGDSAIDEGLFVARHASLVTVIHRRDQLRASRILQERAFADPKIDFLWDTAVDEILGDDSVRGLRLRNVHTEEPSELAVQGCFIFIGATPNSTILRDLVRMDAGGHAYVNEWMETDLPGLFVAGDVRAESARQVVSSAGDGATAAIRAEHYLGGAFPD